MKTLGSVIDEIIKNYGWDERFILDGIREIWDEVLGEKFSQNAKAEDFKNGTLYVKTTGSSWKSEIFLRRGNLMDKLNRELGVESIKNIFIR